MPSGIQRRIRSIRHNGSAGVIAGERHERCLLARTNSFPGSPFRPPESHGSKFYCLCLLGAKTHDNCEQQLRLDLRGIVYPCYELLMTRTPHFSVCNHGYVPQQMDRRCLKFRIRLLLTVTYPQLRRTRSCAGFARG